MKTLIRWYARRVTAFAIKHAATTYGEVASMHPGPCGRCVGRSVESPSVEWFPDTASACEQVVNVTPQSA